MESKFLSSLKTSGLRLTATRLAICQLLAETEIHPTATWIYNQLKGQYPSLSLTTVYNTLDVLVNMGAVHTLGQIEDENVHYEPNIEPHVNLACMKCNSIVDFAADEVSRLQEKISTNSGYRLLGSRVLYYGLCPACQVLE